MSDQRLTAGIDFLGSPKVVCLWVLIEWRRPGVSLMEWELLGWLRLMAIMGALKTISVINAM